MRIFLVGYRCAGKSSTAALLAKLLQKDFCDLDSMIEEKAGRSINDIVGNRGWDFFRTLERESLREVLDAEIPLVATGGGIVLQEGNIRMMRKHGFVVHLKVSAETVVGRMKKDRMRGNIRPPLTEKSLEEEIRTGLVEREPYYQKAAHMEIAASEASPEEIAREIIACLPKEAR